jgi:hypothetical protein
MMADPLLAQSAVDRRQPPPPTSSPGRIITSAGDRESSALAESDRTGFSGRPPSGVSAASGFRCRRWRPSVLNPEIVLPCWRSACSARAAQGWLPSQGPSWRRAAPCRPGRAGPCEPRCPGSPVFAPGLTHRSLRLGLRQNRKPLPCSHRSRGCPRHGAAIRPDGNASGNHQVADNATRTADLRESDKMMLTSYRKSKSRIQGPPARALQSQQELLARILTRGYREAAQVQSWPANVPRRLPGSGGAAGQPPVRCQAVPNAPP